MTIWGISRVPKQYRGFGVGWLVTLKSGEKAVMGDLPSAIILRMTWKVWSTAWRRETHGNDS